MVKRNDNQEEGNDSMEFEDSQTYAPDTDFNLEEEYKVDPLIPGGNYRGNVIAVVYDIEKHSIAWKVALDGNGGVMSDGETPVDGSHQYFRNFLPKVGDKNEMTKDGRMTKHQSKVNMMKVFADGMNINMNTKEEILEAIGNQDWVGIPVIASLVLNEYMGITRNQINKMVVSE